MSLQTVPKNLSSLRACLLCSLVKVMSVFVTHAYVVYMILQLCLLLFSIVYNHSRVYFVVRYIGLPENQSNP